MDVENAEDMRRLARIAMERTTSTVADMAEKFAVTLPPDISAKDALIAFAAAIRRTNAKTWPPENLNR